MGRHKKHTAKLEPGHRWRAQPDHKILALAKGAVRVEIPDTWHVEITDDCVKVFDKVPPDDDCALGISCHPWPAEGAGLRVADLVRETLKSDERRFSSRGPVIEESRGELSLAWGEGKFTDPTLNREARGRICIARRGELQALLTFDFWSSDWDACDPRWRNFLATLEIGEPIADPLKGPPAS